MTPSSVGSTPRRLTTTTTTTTMMMMMMMMTLIVQVRPQGLDLADALNPADAPTTPAPLPGTKAPNKGKGKPAADEFDLADALNPDNDIDRGEGRRRGGGSASVELNAAVALSSSSSSGGFSDSDLIDISRDDGYRPDKGKGGRANGDRDHVNQRDDNGETTAEVGTIAGIVSAVGVALVGAVSSYISYQKKKLCFGIQQSLNAEMVKADNPDAALATEPQVGETLLDRADNVV